MTEQVNDFLEHHDEEYSMANNVGSEGQVEEFETVEVVKFEDLEHLEQTEEFLQHYGVKGMRWGVRREGDSVVWRKVGANEDLKERPSKSASKKTEEKSGKDYSPWDRDDPSSLTQQELQARVKRLQLEKQYAELSAVPPTRSQKLTKKYLQEPFEQVMVETSKSIMKQTVGKAIEKAGVDAIAGASSRVASARVKTK